MQQFVKNHTLHCVTYKKTLKYTNNEYDHFLYFLAAKSESDIHFALSCRDLALPELLIFVFIEKGKKFRA